MDDFFAGLFQIFLAISTTFTDLGQRTTLLHLEQLGRPSFEHYIGFGISSMGHPRLFGMSCRKLLIYYRVCFLGGRRWQAASVRIVQASFSLVRTYRPGRCFLQLLVSSKSSDSSVANSWCLHAVAQAPSPMHMQQRETSTLLVCAHHLPYQRLGTVSWAICLDARRHPYLRPRRSR